MLTFTELLKKQFNLHQLQELQQKKQIEEITFKCYSIYLKQLEYLQKERNLFLNLLEEVKKC